MPIVTVVQVCSGHCFAGASRSCVAAGMLTSPAKAPLQMLASSRGLPGKAEETHLRFCPQEKMQTTRWQQRPSAVSAARR